MAYKYVDPEKLEKRKRRSTKTSGVFSILIGILCLALGVVFFVALKSFGGMLFFLFFTLQTVRKLRKALKNCVKSDIINI